MFSDILITQFLKRNNLLYHSNYYFICTIKSITNSNINIISEYYIINLTENDIFLIPTSESDINNDVVVENITTICSGDISKVTVVPMENSNIDLIIEKTNSETIRVAVNMSISPIQRRNVVKFVENFRNEGSQFLFEKGKMNNLQTKSKSSVFTSFVVFLFVFIICMALSQTIPKDYLEMDEDLYTLYIIFMGLGFLSFVVFLLKLVSYCLKNKSLNNMKNTRNANRPSFAQMSQEQREEVREKRNEDILTSSGPIVSDDENYGGIKKM